MSQPGFLCQGLLAKVRGARRFSTSGFSSERTGRPYARLQMLATALAVRREDARAALAVALSSFEGCENG